jgi:hypothetical protein
MTTADPPQRNVRAGQPDGGGMSGDGLQIGPARVSQFSSKLGRQAAGSFLAADLN